MASVPRKETYCLEGRARTTSLVCDGVHVRLHASCLGNQQYSAESFPMTVLPPFGLSHVKRSLFH